MTNVCFCLFAVEKFISRDAFKTRLPQCLDIGHVYYEITLIKPTSFRTKRCIITQNLKILTMLNKTLTFIHTYWILYEDLALRIGTKAIMHEIADNNP